MCPLCTCRPQVDLGGEAHGLTPFAVAFPHRVHVFGAPTVYRGALWLPYRREHRHLTAAVRAAAPLGVRAIFAHADVVGGRAPGGGGLYFACVGGALYLSHCSGGAHVSWLALSAAGMRTPCLPGASAPCVPTLPTVPTPALILNPSPNSHLHSPHTPPRWPHMPPHPMAMAIPL